MTYNLYLKLLKVDVSVILKVCMNFKRATLCSNSIIFQG